MTQRNNDPIIQRSSSIPVDVDAGLRRYMIRIYNYMTAALVVSGLVAFFVATTPALTEAVFNTPLKWVVMLGPLAMVLLISFKLQSMSLSTLQAMFWGFSVLMGASLASIFLMYQGESIARVFFVTAGTFATMSIYGYTTQKDLTKLGSLCIMGLIGIILASIVNIFVGSSAMQFAISVIGVLVFVGLIAYDTQKFKNIYLESDSHETMGKKVIMGALNLYLDFINLFIMLLRLFGERR